MISLERIPHGVAVPALLAVFVVCGFVSLSGDSATFDETAHIGAGVSYLETGDFRLNPEHPPLAKMLAALPLEALGRGGGRYDRPEWQQASQWRFGFELLNRGGDPGSRLIPARFMILLLGALLALVVYRWAVELFGPGPALLALLLAVTCPTLLAHARLVTTDIPAALGFTATMWLTWRWLTQPSWGRAALTSLALGAALLFKFSCVILAPVIVGLAVAAVITGRIDMKRAATGIISIAVISYALLWTGYGFHYASPVSWDALAREAPISAPISFARDHHVLPEAYLFGAAYAKAESADRVAFLDGEMSPTGWYRYFPEAFLLKTPLAFTALAGWVLGWSLWRTRCRSFDGWCIAAAPLAFTAIAIASRFNIGHRHLTPVYPFLCLAIAPSATWLEGHRIRAAATAALIVSCLGSFALTTPSYLSYFNVAAGGTRGGAKHLVDSNLDWGQDLGRLKRWMDAHSVTQVDLAYFGTADPRAYGIDFRKVALFLDFFPSMPVVHPEPGEYLAVSATFLAGMYLDADRAFAIECFRRGFVERAKVDEYIADARTTRAAGRPVPSLADWLTRRSLITPAQRHAAEDVLPDTWIKRIRESQTPVAWVGDSIAIYRVRD